MGVQVAFNYAQWAARYPEFSNVNANQASAYFAEATLYHNNTGCGPPTDAVQQLALLNMLTAHIAAMNAADANGQPASSIVGRIASASEGSVSVSADMPGTTEASAWFMQTKYGAAYWAATKVFRTMRYLRGRPRPMNPPWFFGQGGF
jgi:Protein of unknown function (DUF4054)